MRTVRTKVYQFSELSEAAKEKAIEWFFFGNDLTFAWENVTEDAIQVGLKIHSLDDHRRNDGEFVESAESTAQQIIENHGKDCETYKTAADFLKERDELVSKHSDGINTNKVAEDNEYEFDQECDELEQDFLNSILEDYRIMYYKEIEYENSEEYAIETIVANEYEFKADGSIF